MENLVLTAQDPHAPHAIRAYAERVKRDDPARAVHLMDLADEMDRERAKQHNDALVKAVAEVTQSTEQQVRDVQAKLAAGVRWRRKVNELPHGEVGLRIAQELHVPSSAS